jgi:nucleoside-diphosphate-sugar epimerase
MSGSALLVGGTGPTGPHIARGLLDRGYDVAVLHRGTHEIPDLADLEHVHADPHFREALDEALGDRSFDIVIATYGRLRHVADALAGHCSVFIAVTGMPVYPGYHEPDEVWPPGMPILAAEEAAWEGAAAEHGVSELGASEHGPAAESAGRRFARLIAGSERHVLALHGAGAFRSVIVRYPSIYGPRQVYPREWSIIRRVLDRRRYVIVPDGGLTLSTRCAAVNAAHFVLTAADRVDAAAGHVFNAADAQQYSLAQWIRLTAAAAGGELEIVSLPFELAGPGRALFPVPHTAHGLVSAQKARDVMGYAEAVPAVRALAEMVRWYIEHPPEPAVTDRLIDTFDYAEEDRLIAAYRAATAPLLAAQAPAATAAHPYAHPKAAGGADHRNR